MKKAYQDLGKQMLAATDLEIRLLQSDRHHFIWLLFCYYLQNSYWAVAKVVAGLSQDAVLLVFTS